MSLYLGENLISGQATLVGESRNIGQIMPSAIPLTDAGLHLLDGALINGSGIYSAFVDAIADLVTDYPDLFVTETDWQTSVSTYGVCGKFVYDSTNNTVRLPKVTGIVEGTTDVTALGDLVEAGLPNHKHYEFVSTSRGTSADSTTAQQLRNNMQVSSLWYNGYAAYNMARNSQDADVGLSSNPVENSIYGNSTTVQPQTIKCYYYIVIATSTKTDIQVDIDEVVTDINSKADVDLSNCTKPHIVETYSNGASWYRVYSDGWCEQGGKDNSQTTKTIYFLKPFKNTNYTLTSSLDLNDAGAPYWSDFGYNRTVNGFSVRYTALTWQASGYIN